MSTQAVDERRPGWLTFAAIVMFAVGFLRIISGINYLADGSQIGDLSQSVFGDRLWVWGIWDLGIAALALAAGLSLLAGGWYGRFIGYFWAIWVIVESFLIIAVAPWFAAGMILLAVLVIYALAVSSDWQGEPQ